MIVNPLAVPTLFLAAVTYGCAEYRLYWGDVHGHTANSDGKGSVEEYFLYARDAARLDFAIVTDHDFGNAAPWRMPQEVWTECQRAADAACLAGEFVAIAGYEWTSQPKYWSGYDEGASESLFDGEPRYYNHKNVYFPGFVPRIFSAKDAAFRTPDLLAAAVQEAGGLVHNNHPSPRQDARDQWDYSGRSAGTIVNTEIGSDVMRWEGAIHEVGMESAVREFLDRGGRTGFVGGSDTHEGRPAARTAVYARALTREGIFEALRSHRCYAVSHARIELDFRIDGHWMGEEIESSGRPCIVVDVRGTSPIAEVAVVRDGTVLRRYSPGTARFRVGFTDHALVGESYYYARVTQTDTDEQGNPSRAWSSPIRVRVKGRPR